MVDIDSRLLAPCGMYCGVCRMFEATQREDRLMLQRLAKIYARRFPELSADDADELQCDGCLATRKSVFCRDCKIRDCTQKKDLNGCHECSSFPCSIIDSFPIPAGRKVMMRAVPYRRKYGTEQWIIAEEERYRCPACSQKLFRGESACHQCNYPVNVD